MTAAAPLSPTGDLVIQTARREVAPGEECTLIVTLSAQPAAPLEQFELTFPGFTALTPPARRTSAKSKPAYGPTP